MLSWAKSKCVDYSASNPFFLFVFFRNLLSIPSFRYSQRHTCACSSPEFLRSMLFLFFSVRYLDVATFGVSALETSSIKVSTLETFDTSLHSDKGRRGAALWEAFKQKGSVAAAAKHGRYDIRTIKEVLSKVGGFIWNLNAYSLRRKDYQMARVEAFCP